MNRRAFGRGLAAAGAGAWGAAAQGQDLGKFFESAARKAVTKAISPENLGRSVEKVLTPRPADAAEAIPFRTADGWTLVAHRYRPAAAPAGPTPVRQTIPPGDTAAIDCWTRPTTPVHSSTMSGRSPISVIEPVW